MTGRAPVARWRTDTGPFLVPSSGLGLCRIKTPDIYRSTAFSSLLGPLYLYSAPIRTPHILFAYLVCLPYLTDLP